MKKSITKIIALSLVAVMMCFALASCGAPNKNPEKAKAALEKAGYTVQYTEANPDEAEGVTGVLVATEKDSENGVYIIYFESASAAKDAWKDAKDEINELAKEQKDFVAKQSGSMIYYGTKDAVKAAK